MYIFSNVTMLVDKDLFVMNKNVNLFVKIKCRFFLIINVFVSMECKELTDNAIIVKQEQDMIKNLNHVYLYADNFLLLMYKKINAYVILGIIILEEYVSNFKEIQFTLKNREDWNHNVVNFSTSMDMNVIVLEDIIKLMEYVVCVQVIKFLRMANVEIDAHVMKYMLDKSVIVKMIMLELMVFAVKDVLLIKFGTDNNVFALKAML